VHRKVSWRAYKKLKFIPRLNYAKITGLKNEPSGVFFKTCPIELCSKKCPSMYVAKFIKSPGAPSENIQK